MNSRRTEGVSWGIRTVSSCFEDGRKWLWEKQWINREDLQQEWGFELIVSFVEMGGGESLVISLVMKKVS